MNERSWRFEDKSRPWKEASWFAFILRRVGDSRPGEIEHIEGDHGRLQQARLGHVLLHLARLGI